MTTSGLAAVAESPVRLVLPNFLSSTECKELEFIHRSNSVYGYRPFVLSTTMSHLVATNCAHLIIPLLPVRERIKEAVEECFGREYDLFVEFTGLISWTKGANIGWHSDNNRPYLTQRHYSAVCYLNTYEQDFKGGLFHFQDGEPSIIIPTLGTLVIYTADERNMHLVEEVTDGERCTLAMWFSSDRTHDEDEKIIRQIFAAVPGLQAQALDEKFTKVLGKLPHGQNVHHPTAASSVMYKAHSNLKTELDQLVEQGQVENPYFNTTSDLRVVRLALLCVSCCFSSTAADDQYDSPVVLTYKHEKVPHSFANILEALQIAQFHQFRSAVQKDRFPALSGQYFNQNTVHIGQASQGDLDEFLLSVQQFETYIDNLWRELFRISPSWSTTGSLILDDQGEW